MNRPHRTLLLMACLASLLALSPAGSAGTETTYSLKRTSPIRIVEDAAGRWYYDGGEVYLDGCCVGFYGRTRRVMPDSAGFPLRGGTLSITLFLTDQAPMQTVTLEGSHDFGDGTVAGRISAATNELASLIGSNFSGSNDAITLVL